MKNGIHIALLNLVISCSSLSAQTLDTLNINQVSTLFYAGGDMFWDLIGLAHYHVPKQDTLSTLFAGHIWLGGLDDKGSLRLAAQTYRQQSDDFMAGPVGLTYDIVYGSRYNKVWKVNQTVIDFHQNNWQDPSYVVPNEIKNWPAHGDTTNEEAFYLAPFVDLNANGVYEPGLGDYPKIRGDQAIFMLFNDDRRGNGGRLGDSMSVEVHALAYAYDPINYPDLRESIFLHYQLFNRSAETYNEAYLGYWADFDIGYYRDDYVGTDSILQCFYGYNRDSLDLSTNGYGYGKHPPAQGISFLNLALNHTMNWNNDFDSLGNPAAAADFYQYLQGRWKDSSRLTLGGNGKGGAQPTNFVLSGDPVNGNGWIANDSIFPLADNRGLMSHGPFYFGAGASICLDIALVYGRDKKGDHLDNLALMRQQLALVRSFYQQQNESCDETLNPLEGSLAGGQRVTIFPNPTRQNLYLQWGGDIQQIRVYDLRGRELWLRHVRGQKSWTIDIKDWPSGVYVVCFGDGKTFWQQKFVIEQ